MTEAARALAGLPKPETMLAYASILEKPQYAEKNGVRFPIPTGEIIEAACAALRHCADLAALPPAGWRDISTAPKDGRQIVVRYKNKDGEDRYTIVRWKEGEWRIGSFNGGKQIFVLAHQYQPNAWCELILPTAALPPAPQRTGE